MPPERETSPAPDTRLIVVRYIIVLCIILIAGGFPIISVMVSSWIADNAGCVLHEGSKNPCIVFGHDIGRLLYTMFVMGWLGLATLPIGALALAGWCLVVLAHVVRALWRRRK
ncbi:hypothetical protein [Pseudochelatococcus contaminans]|uniref:Transmembrane protein n=1 Tax=Pseudochelatococcus contaminans TaxID=1538103 RepID=A0A7W5Z3Q7_9HYPH|nr:hypothetical protein [Pseudochelatococcus contaminans]MBB3809192.1 hypothetical protein [Pseudochelatococcus contaminans]